MFAALRRTPALNAAGPRGHARLVPPTCLRALAPLAPPTYLVALCTLAHLGLAACSDAGDADGDHAPAGCPAGTAAPSDLPVAPDAAAARPLHPHGTATTWNWQLRASLDTTVAADVYDVDLFDTDAATIEALHAAGRTVVCYFSAGSSEDWRADFAAFAPEDQGAPLDGWEGERWLDVRSANVLAVMQARLDLAVAKGCDGVEPDNVDGYTQDSCFPLTVDDQLGYNRAIANEARTRGLSVGLKNDPEQVDALAPYFDFAVVEQCHEFDECDAYAPFVAAGKPVFVAEYAARYRDGPARDALCAASRDADLRTLVLPLELDGSFRVSCDEP